MKYLFAIIFTICFVCGVNARSVDDAQLSCLVEPSQRIMLSSAVFGVVSDIYVERGDAITQGQTLFSLDETVEKASLETYKARSEFAKRKLERNERMFRDKMLSDFEYDESITEFKLAQLAEKEALEKLSRLSVKAPINGFVVSRDISPGEYVSEDPVMELVSVDPLYAEVILRADHYGEIAEGMQVALNISGDTSHSVQGEVLIVDPVIDGASSTFGVRIRIDNPNNDITAGQKCKVFFEK